MNESEVFEQYGELARTYAHSLGWWLPGSEPDDLEQEAMIGLLKACRSFKTDIGQFWPFARMCIRRHLISMLKNYTKQRALPLSESVRRIRIEESGVEIEAFDLVPDPHADVARQLETRLLLDAALAASGELTEVERQAVFGIAFGYSYAELQAASGANRKRIDNANQRARRKLREAA